MVIFTLNLKKSKNCHGAILSNNFKITNDGFFSFDFNTDLVVGKCLEKYHLIANDWSIESGVRMYELPVISHAHDSFNPTFHLHLIIYIFLLKR